MIKIFQGYQIKPSKEAPSSYVIVTDGKGGKIPDVLSGLFTTRTIAMEAIEKYLATKQKKEEVNDNKAGIKSGS